jgi:NADH-quinone oxidoreductase subunit L
MEPQQTFTPISTLWLIPLMPLVGAFLSGAFGKRLQARYGKAPIIAISVLLPWVSFVIAAFSFIKLLGLDENARLLVDHAWTWFEVGQAKAGFSFGMDPLSGMMTLIVTFVGSLIHVYSIGYMHDDESFWRFFSHLNLFLFAMLVLVLGDNILLMFVGWEGVGLCSYLLIGFWYTDVNNAKAGMKAFVVNRIGDFGFLIGFFILFWAVGGVWSEAAAGGYQTGGGFTITFRELPALMDAVAGKELWGVPVLTLVGIFFFVGAAGKSAQIPLYVWLPDAMAGPTPVSALIHAATMVTAGVYMVARFNFLYVHSPMAMTVVAVVGVSTALFAATIGVFQYDIKKVLAYSTVSQLGFMFIGVGVGAYWAGSYHLLTHAFFKACLFLGAGSVILAMHHEQDMRKMGGLGKVMPITKWTYLISCIAIAGFPIASGFFSKDEILWQAFNTDALLVPGWLIWGIGFVAAGLTSFYMFRSYYMTFTGETPKVHGHDPQESPRVVTAVLAILAAFAVLALVIGLPALWTHNPPILEHFLAPVFAAAEHLPKVYEHGTGHGVEWILMISSVGIATLGWGLARWLYKERTNPIPARMLARYPGIQRVVFNKYYVDEAYHATAVRGFMGTSRVLAWIDNHIVDGIVNLAGRITQLMCVIDGAIDKYIVDGAVNLVATIVQFFGAQLRKVQTGRLPAYMAGMAVGLTVLIVITQFLFDVYA